MYDCDKSTQILSDKIMNIHIDLSVYICYIVQQTQKFWIETCIGL